MIVGCGNSALAEQMKLDGYNRNIVSIDFAPTCIDTMLERARRFRYDTLRYMIMDARDLQFDNNSFDSILDKGTVDSALCGAGSHQNLKRIVNEIYRVLKPGGIFISISFGSPDQRRPWYLRPEYEWDLTETVIRKEKNGAQTKHYVFILQKRASPQAAHHSSSSAVGGSNTIGHGNGQNTFTTTTPFSNPTTDSVMGNTHTSKTTHTHTHKVEGESLINDVNAHLSSNDASTKNNHTMMTFNDNSTGFRQQNNGGGASDDSPPISSPEES